MRNLDLGRFRIYPRGFAGAIVGMRVQRSPTNSEARFRTLSMTMSLFKPSAASIDPNPAVKDMYQQYISGRNVTSSFEFKKRVYLIALHAFGTQNFMEWIQEQYKSPMVGANHREFLDDTLCFIKDGRPRRLRLETWDSMLQVEDRGVGSPALSQCAIDFFNLRRENGNELTNVGLVPVLQKWLSQPGGLYDLIGTLHLLFGATP
jgi:hypothetical protein